MKLVLLLLHMHTCENVSPVGGAWLVPSRSTLHLRSATSQVGDKIDYIKVKKIDGDFINGPGNSQAPPVKAEEPASQ